MLLMTPHMAQINFFGISTKFQRLNLQISHNFVHEIVHNFNDEIFLL